MTPPTTIILDRQSPGRKLQKSNLLQLSEKLQKGTLLLTRADSELAAFCSAKRKKTLENDTEHSYTVNRPLKNYQFKKIKTMVHQSLFCTDQLN
jgi:hypothetical protein